jgi:hypothetical protein
MSVLSLDIYAIFGGGQTSGAGTELLTVDVYNASLTKTNPFTLKEKRIRTACTTIGKYGIIAGGGLLQNARLNTVEAISC